MWKRIKNIASFIDDYLIGIVLFAVIVGSIMMLTAQSFVIFIFEVVLIVGAYELPFPNYKILKIASEKVKKLEEEQKQGSVNQIVEEEKEYNTEAMNNQKVEEMICEIDQKLNEGYAFKTISIDKWKNGYRNEIVNLCSCKYELDSDTEKRILSILQILKDDLIDQYYTAYEIKKETTVSALEKLADMDGLTELTLNIRK